MDEEILTGCSTKVVARRKAAGKRRNEERPLGYVVNRENVWNSESLDPHLFPPLTVFEPDIPVEVFPPLKSKKFFPPADYLPDNVHQLPDRQVGTGRNSPDEPAHPEFPSFPERSQDG